MHLVLVGVNHKTAPVELREKLSIAEAQLPAALADLKARDSVSECLILSTCNRTEVYACTAGRADDAVIVGWIEEFCGGSTDDFASHLYSHAGHKAVEHLFRVAAGVDSMVVGEAQILGQVKSAHAAGNRLGSTGPVLNALFKLAVTVGKRARTETDIGRGAFSVGSVAVQLARSILGNLDGRTVLILGAGKMGKLATTHLVSCGASSVLVANRTYERAVEVAEQCGGRPVRFEDLASALETADIVITSTGAEKPIITREMVSSAVGTRCGRPLFLIDMAVPRDIEAGVGGIENVFLYNIDHLQAAVEADAENRHSEVIKVESLVREGVEEFMKWFRTLDAVPVISALRDRFENIRRAELEKLRARLPNLSPEDMEAINRATRSIVNKISHHPVVRIKEYAADQASSPKLETIRDVFGIPSTDDKADDGQK